MVWTCLQTVTSREKEGGSGRILEEFNNVTMTTHNSQSVKITSQPSRPVSVSLLFTLKSEIHCKTWQSCTLGHATAPCPTPAQL